MYTQEEVASILREVREAAGARASRTLQKIPPTQEYPFTNYISHRPLWGGLIVRAKRFLLHFLWKMLGPEITTRERQLLNLFEEQRFVLEGLLCNVSRLDRIYTRLYAQQDTSPSPPSFGPSHPISWNKLQYKNRLRGDESYISNASRDLVAFFQDHHPVLDLGCGPGLFLSLLHEARIQAYGVDVDEDAVLHCLDNGLQAERAEAREHLMSLEPDLLGGIFASHLFEHLDADSLESVLELCLSRLRPSGRILIETPDPRSLWVFSQDFYRDPSHMRPLHPEGLTVLMEQIGFLDISHEGRFPFGPEERLPEPPGDAPIYLHDLVKRLNEHLCEFRSFVVRAQKPGMA